jgi:uncharacterized protein YecE (DUF72 family)
MQTFIGTSGFSYPAWKGSFYPKELKNDQMLRYYAERFSAVEINNTFYRMPKREMLEQWPPQVPASFTFVLKASQKITHMKRLKDVASEVAYFADTAAVLQSQLGPIFFQLHPTMKKDLPRLTDFLAVVPAHVRPVLEFRHESWFADDVYALLHERNAALCVSQSDEGATPVVGTADWGYLRLRRSEYSDEDLAGWRATIASQKWERAYVFFKHEDEARGPVFATRYGQLLAAA